jgi:hypothetical protein
MTIKMIDVTFHCNKNYFLSYKNIARACFRIFDANITAQFKVSNTPSLTGKNSTMTIIKVLDQLQDSYGKPNMMKLFNNKTLFQSPMNPGNSSEMLFYRIKQCQEIQQLSWFWPQSKHEIFLIMIQYLYYTYVGICSCQPDFALIKAIGLSAAAPSALVIGHGLMAGNIAC